MTETLWIVMAVATLFVVAMVFLWFKGGKATVKGGGLKASLETHKPPNGSPGGATMTGVNAGGMVRNTDRTGRGANMRDVTAKGDVENTSGAEMGANLPK